MAQTRDATVIPALSYQDAPGAIEWLCRAFGFEKHAVYEGPNGTIAHAQLVYGNGMIMLGSAREGSDLHKAAKVAGVSTCTVCVVVEDPDAHHARAVEAGARIVTPLADQDYGGRSYSCQDPEGNYWNFGSYDPWAEGASKG